MVVLALDSTTPAGSVALRLPGGTTDVRAGDPGRGWSERLPGDLVRLLEAHGLEPADVDVFAVATGPGSLTGLRVGLATIQGLAWAVGRPVAAVSALDLLAEQAFHALKPIGEPAAIGAWTNALRGEVFTALYELDPRSAQDTVPFVLVEGPGVEDPVQAAARWRRRVGSGRIVIAGDTGMPFGPVLRAALGDGALLLERAPLAGLLLDAAARLAARDALSSPHAVRPLYVRRPDAVIARERATAGGAGRDGPP